MSEITDIAPQVKDKLRCNVYIDNRFCCGLKLETVMRYRLKKGMSITAERLNEIQSESEKSEALEKALNYISVSMKTEREIRFYLRKKGYLSDIEDYVVEKMKDYGYIDDVSYGRQYAESVSKNKGKKLIELKLRQKGLDGESAKAVVGEIENEDETAFRIANKYMRNKDFTKENLYRAFQYLMGKGFEYETAKAAVSKLGSVDEDL